MSLLQQTAGLVNDGDLDALTRHVDDLASAQEWDGLLNVRQLCIAALERGKQLWPVCNYAEYRLALDAPGEWAALMLEDGYGRFALGPLSEVAAATHQWEELAPYAPAGPSATFCAHERVVRGESLSFDRRIDPLVLEIPLELCQWEPAYPLAQYTADAAHFPRPQSPSMTEIDVGARTPVPFDDPIACDALRDLAKTWVTESNGRAESVAVRGDMRDALAALGVHSAFRAQVPATHALALMAWTAASGGAHGRRKGMAAGRYGAWWAAAAVGGLGETWPVDVDELGDAVQSVDWWVWQTNEPQTGWSLRLAVEDPAERLAWAINATDAAL